MANDKKSDGHPPMATIGNVTFPEGKAPPQRIKLITVLGIIVVAVLLILVVKPKELDVYKSFDELQFADAALARCVWDSAIVNDWSNVGQALKLRCNNPSGAGIKSLEGIEHLVDLSDINLAFNRISDVTPLSNLTHLEVVDLSHNSISDLPVFHSAPNLRRIELNFNRIESLSWLTTEHFLALQSLSVAHNHISDVAEIPALNKLSELSIRDNNITDLTPIWQLRELVMLDVGKNRLTNISGIGAVNELRRLFLDRNEFTNVDGIDALANLEELDLSYNRLQSIAPIAGLERLQRLNLAFTGISQLHDNLSLGDLDLLRISGNPDLPCADIAAAIKKYGTTAVRTDKQCPGN